MSPDKEFIDFQVLKKNYLIINQQASFYLL